MRFLVRHQNGRTTADKAKLSCVALPRPPRLGPSKHPRAVTWPAASSHTAQSRSGAAHILACSLRHAEGFRQFSLAARASDYAWTWHGSSLQSWQRIAAKLPRLEAAGDAESDLALLVLITPKLLAFLRPGSNVLRQLAQSVVHEAFQASTRTKIMLALVDSIPHPGNPPDQACDGLSVILVQLQKTEAVSSAKSERPLNLYVQTPNPGSSSTTHKAANSSGESSGEPPAAAYHVNVPLADVRFCWPAVRALRTWHWSRQSGRIDEEELSVLQDRLVFSFPSGINTQVEVVGRPWVLLTPPRVVDGSMGNVIRSVRALDNPEVVLPASQDLEQAVARGKLPVGAVDSGQEIWAIIHPATSVNDLGGNTQTILSSGARLLEGSHMHRVLSGGGEWGSKRSLISLEESGSRALNSQAEMSFEEFLGSKLAQNGDVVQFVGVDITATDTRPSALAASADDISLPTFLAEFGSMLVHETASPDKRNDENDSGRITGNYFGVLSAGGIEVTAVTKEGTLANGVRQSTVRYPPGTVVRVS